MGKADDLFDGSNAHLLPNCMVPDGANGACSAYLALEAAFRSKGITVDNLRAKLAQVEQERDEWRDAVLNAAVISWVPSEDKPPREIINDLLAWATQVALDPAVSEPVAKLVQDRDRLAAEVKELQGESGRRFAAIGRMNERNVALSNQLTAAQQECKHLKEGVSAMEFFLNDVAAALDVSLTAPGRTFAIMAAISFICTRAERAEAQLTTAHQSAQEQFRKGMERAAEIADELDNDVRISNSWIVATKIRAELSKGEVNEH